MKKAFLIVDIGTGNSRAGVIGTDGEILSVVTQDSVYYRDTDFPDSICFNPKDWIRVILDLCKKAVEQAGEVDIAAVSSSSQRQGIVLIDKDGGSLVGYQNGDNRGAEFMEELDWDRIYQLTGLTPFPFYSGLKVLGTMRRQPEVIAQTKAYTSISDWIGYLFTGELVWERSQVGHSLTYDIWQDGWSQELCDMLGINTSMLPPIAVAGSIQGRVLPQIAEDIGISKDAVFVVGAADTQIALVGVQAQPGEITVVSGTTTPVGMVLGKPRFAPCWVSPHAVSGQYMLESNCGHTGINYQRFKNLFMPDDDYGALEHEALERGLPPVLAMFGMGPHLMEEPVYHSGFLLKGAFDMDLKKADFAHALLLDIGFQITTNVDNISRVEPTDVDYIIGCAGGFRSVIVQQTVADLTGKKVLLPRGYDQGTMYGCMHLCNAALDMPKVRREIVKTTEPTDDPERRAFFERWKAYRVSLRSINDIY